MDDPTGYGLDPANPGSGGFVLGNGSLTMRENTPQATLLGSNPVQTAAAWDVNENDSAGADGLQTVAGESVDGVSAYDITASDNAAFKMRGNSVGTDIDANIVMRNPNPVQWQIHTWRFYANAAGTPASRVGFIGTWVNATTPELGIMWDPGHGTFPNNYILVSEGIGAWPTFNAEESSLVSRTTDGWVYVLWAGRTYTLAATTYYDRVVVVNQAIHKDLFTTSIFSPPLGPRFGCIQEGDHEATPAYFDSYRVWQGPTMRYTPVVVVRLPDARPSSMTSVTGYTISTTTTGVDRGGSVVVNYAVSSDGGQTFGGFSEISNITNEVFAGKGDDVIRLQVILVSSGDVPDTGVAGIFAPHVNNIEIAFLPAWREQLATEAVWTEAV